MNKDLFITNISLEHNNIPNHNIYPFNIPIISELSSVKINKNVTFLIGENGTGKSTFIEALAISVGLNPEGGTQNFTFNTKNTHSNLYKYLSVSTYNRPKTKFFLRSESFYNFATELEHIATDPDSPWPDLLEIYGGNLHNCSHGESFLKLIKERFTDHGLYILDEPESALSPQNQLALLCFIDQLVKEGSQFIIATHSPILISYRDGDILDLNNKFKKIKYEETNIYQLYKMYLDQPENMQKRLFDYND